MIIIITMYDARVTMGDGRVPKYYYLLYYIAHVVQASFVQIGSAAVIYYVLLLLLYD